MLMQVEQVEAHYQAGIAHAVADAVAQAQAFHLRTFGASEIWEVSADQVTIRALTENGDDYGLWTAFLPWA